MLRGGGQPGPGRWGLQRAEARSVGQAAHRKFRAICLEADSPRGASRPGAGVPERSSVPDL